MMDAAEAKSVAPATALLYLHPGLKLAEIPQKGYGYVATKAIERGELLLEEKPFVWDCGSDGNNPDLDLGAQWLIRTGAIDELMCPPGDYLTLEERAEAVVNINSYRAAAPCANGNYPAFLFRNSSRFNHSCFPNAGSYIRGGIQFSTVAECSQQTMRTFALDAISKGNEVCICYLAAGDQLSPTESRQQVLQRWGFTCTCKRCLNENPLDSRLRGANLDDFENEHQKREALHRANHEFRALFDPNSQDYNPPMDNFEAALEQLTAFRERNKFLDIANMVMQRIRRELLAILLIEGVDGKVARKSAPMVAKLLLEELHVRHKLLPTFSPCKVSTYVDFLRVLRNVPSDEAAWLEKEAKVDGVALASHQSLWLHDPVEHQRLGLEMPRNVPSLPEAGPPPRRGPEPGPGKCCMPGLRVGEPLQYRPCVVTSCIEHQSWPCGGRATVRALAATEKLLDVGETSMLQCSSVEQSIDSNDEPKLLNLWEAYAEYTNPSAAARNLKKSGLEKVPTTTKPASKTWFKFQK